MTNNTTLTLPSDREIVITRVFDAPRRLVFMAWTTPEHVRQWYGLAMPVCEIDLRVGGKWRYVVRDDDGGDYAFAGEYREIVPPERLVYTDGFEGMPGHEALVTVTFDEQDGKTFYKSVSLYQSVEDRDAHVQSGMETGLRETLDRLNQYLSSLKE